MSKAEIWFFLKNHWSWIWVVTSFFGGLVIGNWFAINRDKRKEWNELTRDGFKSLLKQAESIGAPNQLDCDLVIIETYIPIHKKYFYRRCLDKYQRALSAAFGDYDPITGTVTKDLEKCRQASKCAKSLLHYFKPR